MADHGTTLHFLPPGSRSEVLRRSPRRHRRVICSLAQGLHRQLLAVSSPTLVAYGRRYGWDVVLSTEDLGLGRPASWAKVRFMQELLEQYETVLWIDADALIVNLDQDILDGLAPGFDLYLSAHAQPFPGDPVVPNFGIVVVKQTDYSVDFLDRMWDRTEFVDHNWWESAALLSMLGYSLEAPWPLLAPTEDSAHVGPLDLAWNSVPGLCDVEHPMIRHHARADDRSFETRLGSMTADLEQFLATWGPRPGRG